MIDILVSPIHRVYFAMYQWLLVATILQVSYHNSDWASDFGFIPFNFGLDPFRYTTLSLTKKMGVITNSTAMTPPGLSKKPPFYSFVTVNTSVAP